MLKTRLIPVLLLRNGLLVRSQTFSEWRSVGNPVEQAARFSQWNVDELIYLDITTDDDYSKGRDDHKTGRISNSLDLLDLVAGSCFMPLTWGGRIRTVEDMRDRLRRGADKIAINSAAFARPRLIREGAEAFGSQAIVVCIDSKDNEVIVAGKHTGRTAQSWAREAVGWGAGEILLQSIDRDGTGRGYDLDLIRSVKVSVPLIALGGVGRYEHFAEGIAAGADAVAAANIFHFRELADRNAKRAMARAGVPVRL